MHWWDNQAPSWLLRTLKFCIIWIYQTIRHRLFFPFYDIYPTRLSLTNEFELNLQCKQVRTVQIIFQLCFRYGDIPNSMHMYTNRKTSPYFFCIGIWTHYVIIWVCLLQNSLCIQNFILCRHWMHKWMHIAEQLSLTQLLFPAGGNNDNIYIENGDLKQHIVNTIVGRSLTHVLYESTQMDIMMTSSVRNTFRVTGHLDGKFTGHRWIPRTKASDVEFWCFLWSASE